MTLRPPVGGVIITSGASASPMSAEMPSIGTPFQVPVAASIDAVTMPLWPSRSSAWTDGAWPAISMRSLPRPPTIRVSTLGFVDCT